MATITYNFNVDDLVYHVTDNTGIKKGQVKAVEANVDGAGEVVTYHVQYLGSLVTTPITEDLYAVLDDALSAYGDKLEAQGL